MNSINAMYTHGKFWGSAGAGVLIRARSTGRYLLMHRSRQVNEPGTWGLLGGAIDPGEDPREAAEREALEEAGALSVEVEREPFYTFVSGSFRFYDFLGHVDEEFEPMMNWESQGYDWVTLDDLPTPLHPGVKALLPALRERDRAGEFNALGMQEEPSPWLWLLPVGLVGAAAGIYLLASRKSAKVPKELGEPKESAASKVSEPAPPLRSTEPEKVRDVGQREYTASAPGGFNRATGQLPPEANAWAKGLLGNPYGTSKTGTLSDGKTYYAVVESHFDDHVPDKQGDKYKRWHPGVSLFVKG